MIIINSLLLVASTSLIKVDCSKIVMNEAGTHVNMYWHTSMCILLDSYHLLDILADKTFLKKSPNCLYFIQFSRHLKYSVNFDFMNGNKSMYQTMDFQFFLIGDWAAVFGRDFAF